MFFNIYLFCLKGFSEVLIRNSRQLKAPFLSYADFEGKEHKTDKSYTDKYQDHIPCSYG